MVQLDNNLCQLTQQTEINLLKFLKLTDLCWNLVIEFSIGEPTETKIKQTKLVTDKSFATKYKDNISLTPKVLSNRLQPNKVIYRNHD